MYMNNLQQDAISYQTYLHINEVMKQLAFVQQELMKRQFTHDRSKLDSPEVEMFTEMTSKLKGLTYGSEEYKQSLKDLGPALDHHYSKNRHHPEWVEQTIERWLPIEGYEGIYEVSNLGQIRSLDRVAKRESTGDVFKKDIKLRPHLTPGGYLRIELKNKNGERKNFFIHSLVATTFLPKITRLEEVEINHKDGDKQNNCVSNLEWVSSTENLQHSYDIDLRDTEQLKYIVHCPELDITTYGATKMEKALKEKGYDKALASGILACYYGTSQNYFGLTFEFEKIEKPREFSYVNQMNLIDLIEMVCDWRSSVKRHADGCIYKSLEINKERFKLSDQLYSVIKNTIDYLESRENLFENLTYQDTL